MTRAIRRSLWARKPLAAFGVKRSGGLRRTLGALDLTLLGIGCIMGTGIFVLSGQAAALHAGPAVMLSFVLAAVCAGFGALCYAELSTLLPVSGSAYAYAYATLGELCAFVIGWMLILQYVGGAATVAVGFSGYVETLVAHLGYAPALGTPDSAVAHADGRSINYAAALILLALGALLSRGVRESARLNAVIVAIKMSVVLAFVAFGLPHVQPQLWQPFVPPNTGEFGHFGASGVLQATTLLFFSYLGFDAVSVAAGETKNPQRDVPIGLTASLMVCALLYVAVAAVLTGLVPYTQLGVPFPIALAVDVIGQRWLAVAIDLGALAGLCSVLLVQIYAASRILLSMAEDGFFPAAFEKLDRRASPQRLIALVAGSCAVLSALLPIELLAHLTSVGTLLVFATVGVGVMVLRVRHPEWERRFEVPLGPYLVPSLCVGTSLALIFNAQLQTLLLLMAWLVGGCGIYFSFGRRRVGEVRAKLGYDAQ